MNRRLRPLAALALIAMVALISACGSNAPAASSTAGSGGGGNNTTAAAQKGVKFAECMRSNGVSKFPDPSASGQFTIDAVANGSSLDTSSPAFTQALSACKGLEPAGFKGGTRSTQQQSAALKFAQCIRANGVNDFPDPADGQPLVDTNRIPSASTSSGMSILNAAMQKCGGLAAAAGVHAVRRKTWALAAAAVLAAVAATGGVAVMSGAKQRPRPHGSRR